MSTVAIFAVCIAGYLLYLAAGVHFQFDIGWIDWQDPYYHYTRTTWENFAPFATPLIALMLSINAWYKIHVLGDQ
jgi:hypothetical protein